MGETLKGMVALAVIGIVALAGATLWCGYKILQWLR